MSDDEGVVNLSAALEPRRVLEMVRDYFEDPSRLVGEDVRIVASDLIGDGGIVFVFRRADLDRLEGLYVDLFSFASQFEPNDASTLARIIAADEIAEPAQGEVMRVDWANALVESPESIQWRVL